MIIVESVNPNFTQLSAFAKLALEDNDPARTPEINLCLISSPGLVVRIGICIRIAFAQISC